MTKSQDEYLSELLQLRFGRRPTMLNLEELNGDAVHAVALLDYLLDQFEDRMPGIPGDMVGCSIEHYAIILYAMRNLREAVRLSERGWQMVYETENAQKAA